LKQKIPVKDETRETNYTRRYGLEPDPLFKTFRVGVPFLFIPQAQPNVNEVRSLQDQVFVKMPVSISSEFRLPTADC
jgi:hypothetical protein